MFSLLGRFQDILVITIAKIQFNRYFFTFIVAIYSSSHDLKPTFAAETVFGLVA